MALPTDLNPHFLASSAAGYRIERSLRFNSADSAYLNRNLGSSGSSSLFTLSFWMKTSVDSNGQRLFYCYNSGASTYFIVSYNYSSGDGKIACQNLDAGIDRRRRTVAELRDPSAWYHIVIVGNNSLSGGNNVIKIYVNGVQQDTESIAGINDFTNGMSFKISDDSSTGGTQYLSNTTGVGGNFFNGYLTEVNFIDGFAYDPSYFGETDTATGVWKPKAYSDSYGTNGFYLKFADNSNTTAATLGKDSSGNGNNWTPNNFSVTAGAGNDSLVDTPTSYGTDTGAGGEVRGNYCTLNPLMKGTGVTLSDGNLTATMSTALAAWALALSTMSIKSGKWYWEVTHTNGGGDNLFVGIAKTTTPIGSLNYNFNHSLSDSYNFWGYTSLSGQKEGQGAGTNYGASFQTAGDIVGVALDMDAGTITFYKNGTSQGQAFSGITVDVMPAWGGTGNSISTANMNFGQRPFAYTAPSGFKALCTQNLPTPTIGATSTTQAGKYFNTVLYTGNGSTQTISGVGFQPDFVWIKSRSNAYWHTLMDAVRGRACMLFTNRTDAEYSTSPSDKEFTAFTSDGFSLGPDFNYSINSNTATFAAWNWKANGAGSSNTDGTITSTVSASTTSGFSIVTYTGTGSNATVGHGLGAVPSMIIVKHRTAAAGGPYNWRVYHEYSGNVPANEGLLALNTTAAVASSSTAWNSTSPTSTVFSIGTDAGVNANTTTYVAYCFAPVAGYSAFGSYTGNGSTDGPFVYTGFRPRYIMIKKSSAASSTYGWQLFDTARSPYNVAYLPGLWADASAAEAGSAYGLDILSNGFKIRLDDTNNNATNQTMIYAAFAEFPFKYSLAR